MHLITLQEKDEQQPAQTYKSFLRPEIDAEALQTSNKEEDAGDRTELRLRLKDVEKV